MGACKSLAGYTEPRSRPARLAQDDVPEPCSVVCTQAANSGERHTPPPSPPAPPPCPRNPSFHYSVPGGFDAPTARDISPKPRGPFGGAGDPMYVVTATKKLEA